MVALGLAVLGVVLFGRLPGQGRWVIDLSNAAHGPAFALVTLVVFALLRHPSAPKLSILGEYSAAILISILLGAVVELLQYFTGRDAELGDLWRDALGAVAAAGTLLAFDPRVRASPAQYPLRRMGLLVTVAAGMLMLAPLAATAAAYLQRYRSFPTLIDFGSPVSTYFLGVYSAVTVEREALPIDMPGGRQGTIGLHARLDLKNGWWGISLQEPSSDWRGYDWLALDLANPTDVPLLLKVRVRDQNQVHDSHSGYITDIVIAPRSRRTWIIPLEHLATAEGIRHVDTAIVSSIVLSRKYANRATDFYLMRIWLE